MIAPVLQVGVPLPNGEVRLFSTAEETGGSLSDPLVLAAQKPKTRAIMGALSPPDVNPGEQSRQQGPSRCVQACDASILFVGGLPGKFSLIEHNSGTGDLSLTVARAFPEATIISVEVRVFPCESGVCRRR